MQPQVAPYNNAVLHFFRIKVCLLSLAWRCCQLQRTSFDVNCNHIIVWSYHGFIKSYYDDVNDENEGTYIYVLFAFKIVSLPVPTRPGTRFFCDTRPVLMSKTPTRRALFISHSKGSCSRWTLTKWANENSRFLWNVEHCQIFGRKFIIVHVFPLLLGKSWIKVRNTCKRFQSISW